MIELRIKEIAKERGITLSQLAKDVGIAQPSISRMVNGVIMPSWDTLERISRILDVSPYELFSDAPRAKEPIKNLCPHCHEPIIAV